MATIPKRGEVWVDLRPTTDRREWRDSTRFRRVVTVIHFDVDGFAEGKSAWQTYVDDAWTTMDYPAERYTRIRAGEFARRFVLGQPAVSKDSTE